MRAIQKRTTIHIIGPCIGAFSIDNGDLIWVGKIAGLHFTGWVSGPFLKGSWLT